MVKSDSIRAVADRSGVTQKDVRVVMECMSDVVLDVIAREDSVKFGEVCTFSGVTKAARTARNPKTGETVDVPAKSGYPKCKFTKTAKA